MKRPARLSASFVRAISIPGRYGDGRGGFGLSLLVKDSLSVPGRQSKTWSQRLRIDGKPINIGLGSYPLIQLAEARDMALENARAVRQGHDPRSASKRAVPTLAQALDAVIDLHSANWRDRGRSEKQWRASMETYVLPRLGHRPVDAISTADVLAVLLPIWNEKRETARRVRQRISATMKWAIAQGHRQNDPAGDAIAEALPKNSIGKVRHKALPHDNVAAAVATIRATRAHPATRLALEFLVLTAARSGEVRGARWDEIDLDSATWTIPADRMKAGKEHRVPLSDQAVAVLARAREYTNGSGLVFPGPLGREVTSTAYSKLLHENDVGCVPHGFRSSFRDWCSETGQPRELAEHALAHVVKGVEGAYQRSDLFNRRRALMAAWADHVMPNEGALQLSHSQMGYGR